MKSLRKTGSGGFPRSRGQGGAAESRKQSGESREGLALLLIALLILANVVVYLCHHYGLTSFNEWRGQVMSVMVDYRG
jgi:hypothetical protein